MSFDFSELKAFQQKLEKLEAGCDEFVRSCTFELAEELLERAVGATPIKTGFLQRGWAAINKSMIARTKNTYEIDIVNDVVYASYVELGHRIMRKGVQVGYQKPRYFLKKCETAFEAKIPAMLDKKLEKYIKETLND